MGELLQRVHAHCDAEGWEGWYLREKVGKATKRWWIRRYLGLRAQGRTSEAEQLTTLLPDKRGRKAVFTPEVRAWVWTVRLFVPFESCQQADALYTLFPTLHKQVEEDMKKCIFGHLGTLEIGVDVEYLIGLVQGWITEKPDWQQCIDDYSKGNVKRWEMNHEWLRSHLIKWGFSFRKGTTAARKLPPNVNEVWDLFIQRFAFTIRRDLPEGVTMLSTTGERVPVKAIPPEMVVNADQTAVAPISYRNATWTRRGCKDVALMGEDDKRKMTAVLGSNAAGEGMGMQTIFTGKTDK